ncbi:MAG: hypothetical protein V1647_04510 [Pseudomonadota bacterium]
MKFFLLLAFLFGQYAYSNEFRCVINLALNGNWADMSEISLSGDEDGNAFKVYLNYDHKHEADNKAVVFNITGAGDGKTAVFDVTDKEDKVDAVSPPKTITKTVILKNQYEIDPYKKTIKAFPKKSDGIHQEGGASFREKYTLGVANNSNCTDQDIILMLLIIDENMFSSASTD